jgi:hypothetical protein
VDHFELLGLMRRRARSALGLLVAVAFVAFPAHSRRAFQAVVAQRAQQITRQLKKALAPALDPLLEQSQQRSGGHAQRGAVSRYVSFVGAAEIAALNARRVDV